MKRALIGLIVVVGAGLLPAAAYAASPNCGKSFVDRDSSGSCSTGDLPLGPLLADGAFISSMAEGSYTPPANPVSVVINDFSAAHDKDIFIVVDGDVRVDGHFKADGIILLLAQGNISVARRVHVNARGRLEIHTTGFGLIDLGERAQIAGRNSNSAVVVEGVNIRFRDDHRILADDIDVTGTNVDMGDGVRLSGGFRDNHVSLTTRSDLVATDLDVRGGSVSIESRTSNVDHSARHIALTNSRINQMDKNGTFLLEAHPDADTGQFAPDGMRLVNTRISARAAAPVILPAPTP